MNTEASSLRYLEALFVDRNHIYRALRDTRDDHEEHARLTAELADVLAEIERAIRAYQARFNDDPMSHLTRES